MRYIKGGVAMCYAEDLKVGEVFVHDNSVQWEVVNTVLDTGNLKQIITAKKAQKTSVFRAENDKTSIFEFGRLVNIDLVPKFETKLFADRMDERQFLLPGEARKLFPVMKLSQVAELMCVLNEGVNFKGEPTNLLTYLESTGTGNYFINVVQVYKELDDKIYDNITIIKT